MTVMKELRVVNHLAVAGNEINHALMLLPHQSKERRDLENLYGQLNDVRCCVLSPDEMKIARGFSAEERFDSLRRWADEEAS